VQVSENLGEVSWETVAQLSGDFQASVKDKQGKARKIIKELQMSRLLLMDRIRQGSPGRIDPKLLVDVVRLLQRCEEVAAQYDLDLHEFSTFLYLVSEKLKKEKIARYRGSKELAHLVPIKDELSGFKSRGEPDRKKKGK
jgi:hypothetical protein